MSEAPRVTCIMPTRDRREFVPAAVQRFLEQDYESRELLVHDDGEDPVKDLIPADPRIVYVRTDPASSVGAKRNALCRQARGEIVVHWDDDDWYPSWRIRRQVEALAAPEASVCGTSTQYFHEPSSGRAWRYQYAGAGAYVTGATLAYKKAFWQLRPFPDVRVGEDTKFVQAAPRGAIVDLALPALCVGTIHTRNVSPKWPVGPAWAPVDPEIVRSLMGREERGAVGLTASPRVSCIMPTADRGPFVELSLELFAAQRGVEAELIVVDSGGEAVDHLCQRAPGVRYLRATRGASIGAQRNMACAQARGDVIVHWDDDDWYAPERLARQVAPILEGRADVTGLDNRYTLNLHDATFWTTTPQLHRRMFVGDVHGGTLAYRRALLGRGVRYRDVSLAEDAALLDELLRGGARLERVANDGVFVYMRHGRNAWRFEAGAFVDAAGWSRTDGPPALPPETVARYRAAVARRGVSAAPASPGVAGAARWPGAARGLDCFGNTELALDGGAIEVDRCVVLAVTEAYAHLLEGALASLARFGGLDGIPRFVFVDERARACESLARRFGATVLRVRHASGHAASIKGVFYSLPRVVKASQYLCLDADVLVLEPLAPLWERHAALGPGTVLIAPEATVAPVPTLRDALSSVYLSTPVEIARLLGRDPRAGADACVVNDGLFVADAAALSAIDALLRGDVAIRDWVNARGDVWWRQKGALNLALSRLGAARLLEPSYNAQLHVAPATREVAAGRTRALWRGEPARVLHFNGRGKEAHATWRAALDAPPHDADPSQRGAPSAATLA